MLEGFGEGGEGGEGGDIIRSQSHAVEVVEKSLVKGTAAVG